MFLIARAVIIFTRILTTLLVIEAIMSWFVGVNPQSQLANIYRMLSSFTEPIVYPFRLLLHRMGLDRGMLDFSLLFAMIAIQAAGNIIVRILLMF